MKGAPTKRAILGILAVAFVGVTAGADAAERHACLAYSEATHHWGWAVDYPTAAEATAHALRECGAGCTARLNWHAGCGAYAEGQRNVHYGWAVGATREIASSAAIATCSRMGGGAGCTIRNWACN